MNLESTKFFVMTLEYFYSKFLKKVLRGKCIRNSHIDSTAKVNSRSSIVESSMGAYSYCSYDCNILYTDIGRYCSIANDVIIGGDEHPMEWLSTSPVFQDVKHSGPTKRFAHHKLPPIKRTAIENDVWIGDRVIIKQGVTIGTGAVIGAGAVVTKDVPPYAVVAGVPAKVIKYRCEEATFAGLLRSEWWNMSPSELECISDKVIEVKEYLKSINRPTGGGNFVISGYALLKAA